MNKYYYDLHIHSCLSPCGDDDMTPNNIAGMAALKGLQIIALTDHNTCKNCPAFFAACRAQGIVPIAGMELSTAEDVHIVCLFEELDKAMEFDKVIEGHLMNVQNRPEIFGTQHILNEEDEVIGKVDKLLISATDLEISEAVELARRFGAHVHPAHVDRESNGIVAILGDIPADYGFSAVEFNDRANVDSIKKKYQAARDAVHVVSSDAHYLWDINEAENYFEIDDKPYSSAFVRKRLLALLG